MNVRGYILKVWASSIAAAPILFLVAVFLFDVLKGEQFSVGDLTIAFGLIIILLGFVLSLPALCIVLLLSSLVARFIHKPVLLKVLLFVIQLVFIFLTMRIIGWSLDFRSSDKNVELFFSVVYGAAAAIFSLVYKLMPKSTSLGEV